MKEIEVKILNVNRIRIEEVLSNLGAEKVFDNEIETLFFDFKDNSIVKAKNVLRLRKEEGRSELTFKRVTYNEAAKVAEEVGTEVSDPKNTQIILEALGLTVIDSMRKHRVSYKLKDTRFDIDKYQGDYEYVPEFLEIEGANTEEIHKYANLLGYDKKDCLPWSTPELINHYSKL
jgi:adenylate cyclase class 2